MRKLYLLFVALISASALFGQLSGTYYIPGGASPSYPTIAAAIADLNAQGVGSGGAIFRVVAGYTETLTDSLILTASGRADGALIFQKIGAGANPIITRTGAGVKATSLLGGQGDAVLILQGCDYVVFDAIDIATANQGIEYGYYLRKADGTDGCKNITIKNCNITMTKGTSAFVAGIYASNNISTSAVNSSDGVLVTGINGRHENVTITGNTIGNVSTGIILRGYGPGAAPYEFYDQNFVIGAVGEGNTIQNFGGGHTGTTYGVYSIYNNNAIIGYNTVNNTAGGGVPATGILYGIYNTTGVTAAYTAASNTVTLTTGAASSALYGIYSASTGTLAMNSNTVELNTNVTTSGALYYLYNGGVSPSITMGYNIFRGTSLKNTGTTYLMYNSVSQLTPGVTNIESNALSGSLTKTSASGVVYCYYNGASPTGTENFFNNSFSNITNTGASVLAGYYSTTAANHTQNVYSNTFTNFTGGSGIVYPIYASIANTKSIYGNVVKGITGTGNVYGIYVGSGNATTHIRQNQVYNLTSIGTTTLVYGIYGVSGTNISLYNNFISDLKAPSTSGVNAINGIFVTAAANVNVYYNTIYLNSSSTGATFGSSAVYAGTASTKLDLRNNILVNKSSHNGNTGYTVALRRNGAFDAVNYAETSNTNDLFVSSASPILNYIYYDGTSGLPGKDSTIDAFKARVYPRDAGSFTENPPFIDVAATPFNLHMQETQTKCESGGSQISAPFAISTDVDNQLRFPDPSCPNNPSFPASAPDVGADEFAGTPVFTCALPDPGNTLSSVDTMCSGQTTTLSIQNLPTGTGNSFQWQISPDNVNYSDMPNAITASYTFTPSATAYYKCRVTCQQVPALVSYSNPLLVSMKYNITSATGSERCGTGSVKLLAEGTGPQLNWYDVPIGGVPVGSGSPFFSPVISSTTTYYVGTESPTAGSVTIGAGATTSATYSNPFYSAWSNTHNQHMIRASELNAAGLTAGDITSLAINITSVGLYPMIDFSLKMGMTSATDMSAFVAPAFTEVYANPSLMPIVGINTMVFTTPFNWDGLSNLVIEICHGNGGSTSTMSRTCLADNTPFISTIHTQVSAATAASVICADITTNKLTYSVRPQWTLNGTLICSSPRVPVVASVVEPPLLDVTENSTVCNNAVLELSVLSNTTLFDVYEWSPVTNLFTDAACTTPYTGGSALSVYVRSTTAGATTYSCTALNSTSFCSNVDNVTVTILPETVEISALPTSLCVSGSTTLSAVIPAGYGDATFQWAESIDGLTFYDIQGATNLSYTTPYIGQTTYYKLAIRNSANQVCLSPQYQATVLNPLVTGTTPGFHCGPGVVELGATSTTGLLTWYGSQNGGLPLGTGSTFTTPYLWETQNFYVSALEPGTILESAGKLIPAVTTSGLLSGYGMVFTANEYLTLQSVDVYPAGASGQLAVALYNSAQSIVYPATYYTYPAGNGTTPYTIPLDYRIPAGTGYRLLITVLSGGNLIRETSGTTYPISNGTLLSLTSAATSVSGTSTTTYNWFFNWRVRVGCSSPLTPVTATINLAPFYVLSEDQAICNSETALVTVTNGTSYFDSFTWLPADNLFTDPACTIPYDTGIVATTLYFKSTVPGNYEIRGYANNTLNGCTNFDTTHVVVLPATLAIASDPDSLCVSGSAALTLIPAMDYGSAKIQWQSSPDGLTFTDISGATNSSYNTGVISATTFYKVIIKNHSLVECLSAQKKIYVDTPAILTTTPGARCGTGTVELVATCTPGSTVNWYGSALGGLVLGTGTNFTTPSIATTTTYYAAAVSGNGGGVGAVGPVDNTFAAGSATTSTYYVSFNVEAASMVLQGLHVYPAAAGDVKLNIANSAGTVLVQITYPVTAADINVKTYIPVNFPITAGSAYRISQTSGCVSLFRNTTGASYPYTLPGVVSITGNSFGAAYYYYFYDWRVSTKCSSPTVPVIATVIPSNPVNITPSRSICTDEIHEISVSAGSLVDYDVFTWSPTYDLYIDAAATLPYIAGMNKSTVYFKSPNGISTTYTCHAENTSNQCNSFAETTVTVIPDPVISSSPEDICVSGTANISLEPATGYGAATFQWQSSTDNATFTNIEGATAQTYLTPVLTSTVYYKVIIKNSMGVICSEPTYTMTVNNPQLLSTTPAGRCGPGTVQLEATVTPGATLNWYTAATGGTLLATGSPFTTPFIELTTSYFAAASDGGSSAFVGKVGIEPGAGTGGGLTTYMNFTAISDFKLLTVDLFPYGTAGGPGTVTIELRTSTGTPIMSRTVNVVGANSTSSPAQRVSLDFDIAGGASYRLGVTSWTGGVSNLYRDATNFTYPYTLPGVVSITGPSLAGYYYFFYNWQVTTGCESPRQEVLASVTPPPDLFITAGKTICTNEVYPIEVTSPLAQFDSYTWSPVDNLFTDAACTQPYVALASASTVYVKGTTGSVTTYTCAASNSTGLMCANYETTTVTVLPVPVISSTPEAICFSGDAVIKLQPATGYGLATFQWQDSPDNAVFTNISGATNQNFTTPVLLDTRYYKVIIRNEAGVICSEPVYTMAVSKPQVASTTPGTRCGVGTTTLGATALGGSIKWYANSTGGATLGTGNTFTTPVITNTTNFYAEAVAPGSMEAFVGMESSANGTSGSGATTYGLYFDAISAFTLKTVNVYPNAASNNSPGTVTISVINSAGTVLHQATVNVVGYIQSTNPTMQTVDLNFEILPATNLRLVMTAKTVISGLMFQPSAQGPYPFPYTLDGVVSITSGTYGGTVYPSLYYYFYNWKVTKGCASARTAVAAVVTPPPAINATATPAGVCESSSTVIKVTSSNAPYTYNWMPGSLNGSTHTVYPLANTTYIVTASDAVSGCVNMDTVAVTVLATPTPITVTPAAPIINPGDIQPLTATGGTLNSNGVFGTGTTTNTTTGYPAPYTNYYGGTKHQMLIKASELTAQGLFPGASITSLTFTVTAVGTTFTGVLNNFQIDVGHTTQTVLTSSAFLVGLTNVLPASSVAIAVGTVTHTFAVPYTWDGTRNIVIQTSYNNGNNGTSTDFVQMSNTVQSFVGCNYYRADALTTAQILGALTPTGSTTSRPNMTLGYNSPVLVTWVPYTNLYRNATATLPYTGQSLTTVYAKPSQTTTYTVLSLAPLTSCLRSKTVTVTVTSPCQSPTNVGATSITASTANIAWTAPASPPGSGYQYEVRISGAPGSGPTGLAVTGTTGAGVTNASLSGLTSSTLYHVYVRANCGDDVYSDWTADSQFTTLAGVPENRTVGNITVNTGQNNCYDATNTITVAGSGTTFMVQSGGSATFIAGMKILYLPGTSVLSGGYMLGKIAPSGPFCSPAKLTEVAAGAEEVPVSSERAFFTLYPNPTNGNFTLVQKGDLTYGDVKVEVYSISGKIVLTESLVGQQKHEFRFSEMPSGLYFVKVVADDYVETIKLVKTR